MKKHAKHIIEIRNTQFKNVTIKLKFKFKIFFLINNYNDKIVMCFNDMFYAKIFLLFFIHIWLLNFCS